MNDGSRGLRCWDRPQNSEAVDLNRAMQQSFFGPQVGEPNGDFSGWESNYQLQKETWSRAVEERTDLLAFLQNKDNWYLIPMKEPDNDRKTPQDVLSYMIDFCGINPKQIVVMNHESAEGTVRRAQARGVNVIRVADVIDCLYPQLREITGIELQYGKGTAMLAGTLFLRMLTEKRLVKNIFWHDSEIVGCQAYHSLEYLALPFVEMPGHYRMVLQAHTRRNNESVFSPRFALDALTVRPDLFSDPKQAEYISFMHLRLLRLVHMLAGERILSADDMFSNPFTHCYGLETLTAVTMLGREITHPNKTVAQVVNFNQRIDGNNAVDAYRDDRYVEQLMMNSLARVLMASLTWIGKPPHLWSLNDITSLNQLVARLPQAVAYMPPVSGAALIKSKEADRFIPSVNQIFSENLVDVDSLYGLASRYL